MNENEFLKLISENQGIIHKICRLYRDTVEDREDLFQEITFQLWKSIPAFKGNSAVSTWLYRVALNTALISYRKKHSGIRYTSHVPDLPDTPTDAGTSQEERLFACLKKLNEGDRAIITLYLDDLTYRQIAEALGISESNVGVKINRIKNKLQHFSNQKP